MKKIILIGAALLVTTSAIVVANTDTLCSSKEECTICPKGCCPAGDECPDNDECCKK